MRSLAVLAVVSVAFGLPCEGRKNLINYRLVSAEGVSAEAFRAAERLGNQGLLDLWSQGTQGRGSILFSVAPEHFVKVEKKLANLGSKLSVLEDDIQKLVDEERADASYSTFTVGRPVDFNEFETYEQIAASLEYYSRNSSVLPVVERFSIGKTVEKRDIYGIRISNSIANKSVIFIECGMHAREWAATSTCLYIIDRLITRSAQHKALLNRYEFHIIPSSNPDGYVYTHTTNRLWVKNRSKQSRGCMGVDLYRNFAAGPHCGVGTSKDPCSDLFCGPVSFSEPESAALRHYISGIGTRIDYYVSLHAFGLMWMFPYAHLRLASPDNDELSRKAKIGVEAISNARGSKYKYGQISASINDVTGTPIDWAYINQNITKSFLLELPPGSDFRLGARGFLLNKNLIRLVGHETLIGLEAMWLS